MQPSAELESVTRSWWGGLVDARVAPTDDSRRKGSSSSLPMEEALEHSDSRWTQHEVTVEACLV